MVVVVEQHQPARVVLFAACCRRSSRCRKVVTRLSNSRRNGKITRTRNRHGQLSSLPFLTDNSRQESCAIAKIIPRDAAYTWVPWKLVSPTNIRIKTTYVNVVTSQGVDFIWWQYPICTFYTKKSTPIYSIPMSHKGVTSCNDGKTCRPQGTRKTCFPKISPCSTGSRWMTFGLWRAKMLG